MPIQFGSGRPWNWTRSKLLCHSIDFMGMFDSIYLNVKCPRCGIEKERECQTKELNCDLNSFKVGDSIGTEQFVYLNTITDCPNCYGYQAHYFFYVRIFIEKGIVTNNYKIL